MYDKALIDNMPLEYYKMWIKLDIESRRTLMQQTRFYDLKDPFRIAQFWKTRNWLKMFGMEPKRVFSKLDPYGEEIWET